MAVEKKEEQTTDWNKIAEDPNSRENFENFQAAVAAREDAQEAFAKAAEMTDFLQFVDSAFDSLMGPIGSRSLEMNEQTQATAQALMENEQRRQELIRKLEQSKVQYQETHAALMMAILQATKRCPSEGETEGGDDEEMNLAMNSMMETTLPLTETDAENNPNIADWESLFPAPPPEAVQLFLKSQSMMADADTQIETAFHEIKKGLLECLEHLTFMTTEAYDIIMKNLDEQQSDIQGYMANNFERRAEMEARVTQQAEQTKSMLTRLMEQISSYPKNLFSSER